MICAAEEIKLGDEFPAKSETEILDLSYTHAKPGAALDEVLGKDDVILEVVIPSDYRNLVNGAIINMFIALAISSLMYTLIIVVYMNRAVRLRNPDNRQHV